MDSKTYYPIRRSNLDPCTVKKSLGASPLLEKEKP